MNEKPRIQAWSCGGGTQSAAIAVLICMGELSPDISIIVDTERETSEVWDYLDKYVHPALQKVGVKLQRIPKSLFANNDLWGGKNDETILIPAFTDENGGIGKLTNFCSGEWKKRVIRRFLNTQYPDGTQFTNWIGFSVDEPKRIFQEIGKWQPRFPLIEKRLRRSDCIKLVERFGWPTPPRSSCWMCPNRAHAEWMHLKHNFPDDWQKAVDFEIEIRKKDDALWLTKSGKPLSELPENTDEPDLFTGRCGSGNCFV